MQKISDKMGDAQFAKVNAICIDCGEDFILSLERTSSTEIKIDGGVIGKKDNDYMFKCQFCFDQNESFSKNEIWSRIVGYLRPTCQWNDAKKTEHKMRTFYKAPE